MIESGRTIEFPMTGTVALKAAWGAGEELLGGDNSRTETFVISLDARPMAAHFELDNVDLMITQWEYRQELARQAGQTLANARDKQIAAFIAGAAGVDVIDGAVAGTDVRGIAAASLPAPKDIGAGNTEAEALAVLAGIEDFLVDCQENDVPVGAVYCAVPPRLFQQIRRLGVADSHTTPGDAVTNMQPMFGGVAAAGGLGAQFTQGLNALSDSLRYMGVIIVKSNHLPTIDYTVSGSKIGEDRYNVQGDLGDSGTGGAGRGAGIRGLIWMPEAVASVRKTGLVVDTEDDIRRNTTFTVASMLSGTGILKPELAKALVDDTGYETPLVGTDPVADRASYLQQLNGGSAMGYTAS